MAAVIGISCLAMPQAVSASEARPSGPQIDSSDEARSDGVQPVLRDEDPSAAVLDPTGQLIGYDKRVGNAYDANMYVWRKGRGSTKVPKGQTRVGTVEDWISPHFGGPWGFSVNGRRFLFSVTQNQVGHCRVYNTGTHTTRHIASNCYSPRMSADGQTIVYFWSSYFDNAGGPIFLFDPDAPRNRRILVKRRNALPLAVTPDGRSLAYMAGKHCYVLNIESMQSTQLALRCDTSAAFNSDGDLAFIHWPETASAADVYVWRSETGEYERITHGAEISSLDMSLDGSVLAFRGYSHNLTWLNMETGERVSLRHTGRSGLVDLSSDGRLVLYNTAKGYYLWRP